MKICHWQEGQAENEGVLNQASTLLLEGGKALVSPTKVGYIIMTIDRAGLERKFMLKGRPRTKPGVVLCSSTEQVEQLAHMDDNIKKLYQECAQKGILLGCILPWKAEAADQYIPADGTRELIMDARHTSCFVICFGKSSEAICKNLWTTQNRLVFASSANPSGQGNRGQLEGVGTQILNGVDLAIEGDAYVAAQQPHSTAATRHEQGVMVSMVDSEGKLTKTPTLIRKGLMVEQIMLELSKIWQHFDYRHGSYY